MIWIQSVICSLVFVLNFAWRPANLAIAVALNILLALSCAMLLGTSRREAPADSSRVVQTDAFRNIVVAALVSLFLAASLAKLNGSSTALWQNLADQQAARSGLIAGRPKEIRSDEWLVHTPWIWSQANQSPAFPTTNRNIGDGVMPLLTNVPVRHWTTIFRPQMWGFFVFDLEHGFAFNWNFKWFGLLLGSFLFFRVIARGNDFLAFSGALLLLYSSYVQWFFSTPTCMPELVAMLFFGMWALSVLFRTGSRSAMMGAGLVLLIAIEQFVFCCYPRFQIPLAYLALALVVGGIVAWRRRFSFDLFRFGTLCAVLVIAAVLLNQWYGEVSATIKEIEGLIYPGQTVSAGGSYPWSFFFAPFFEFSMTNEHFPLPAGNVCEGSGFLFLAPLLVAVMIRDMWRKQADPLIWATILFLTAAIGFMAVGVPLWLARATGWSHVVSIRVVLAVGVASIIGLVRHLALPVPGEERTGTLFLPVSAAAVAVVLFGCFWAANQRLASFATVTEVTAAAIFFATAFVLIWKRFAIASCILLLIPSLYASGLVNPISHGLPGINKSATYRWFADVHENDPAATWLVVGNASNRTCSLAQLLKATGANVLGGTRCMPDRMEMGILDPENRFTNVYNRYARTCFVVSNESEPTFELRSPDSYRVYLPLRTEWLERLGVGYVVVVDQPDTPALDRFELMAQKRGCVLLCHVSR